MAEAAQEQAGAAQDQQQQESQQLLQHHLAMAFGEQPAEKPIDNNSPTPTPSAESGDQGQGEQPSSESAKTLDVPSYLKTTFGWETTEQGLTEIQELRKLKETPSTSFEPKFESEEGKTVYELLRQGKVKDALDVFSVKNQISSLVSGEITKDSAAEIIKLNLSLSNKRLEKDDIEFQYKQEYGLPKEPVQKSTEDEDEFKERHDEWKERCQFIEQKRIVAAKMAIPNLEKHNSEIKLPDLNIPQSNVDTDYEDWKASNAKANEAYNNVIAPSINSLKETDLQLKVKVDDPNNQMQFEVSIAPDVNDVNEVKKDSLSSFEWLTKVAFDEKGSFKPERLSRVILLEKYFDKFAQSIARQAVNAERKRVVSKESSGSGVVRSFNVNPQQMTELQKEAEKAFAV